MSEDKACDNEWCPHHAVPRRRTLLGKKALRVYPAYICGFTDPEIHFGSWSNTFPARTGLVCLQCLAMSRGVCTICLQALYGGNGVRIPERETICGLCVRDICDGPVLRETLGSERSRQLGEATDCLKEYASELAALSWKPLSEGLWRKYPTMYKEQWMEMVDAAIKWQDQKDAKTAARRTGAAPLVAAGVPQHEALLVHAATCRKRSREDPAGDSDIIVRACELVRDLISDAPGALADRRIASRPPKVHDSDSSSDVVSESENDEPPAKKQHLDEPQEENKAA